MTTKISFADLTHTGQVVAANTFPLGISYVAAYAAEHLGDEIDFQIFKYPHDFSEYLETNTPDIACFSAFSWNIRLGHAFARQIKKASPNTICVFGGPNFPSVKDEQAEFLAKFPGIDCYFEYEGELALVEFFQTIKEMGFDWNKFTQARTTTPNIRYLVDGELVTGDLGAKIRDLSQLPSPYLNGHFDKCFDDVLIPAMQTTRGCPFTCTFCWEGGDYFDKTIRFAPERIEAELHYIAERVGNVPDLQITDANFGMFRQDKDTAQIIAGIKAEHKNNWPKSILAATAKNHKERTIEIVELLGDTMPPTAAVQSTDDQILLNIHRKNVSLDALIALAKAVEKEGGQSESEMILCLEGDNIDAHFKTVCDMLDANMTFIRMYQFMMLPGTQSSSKETRSGYKFETRFRVLPRCFGTYDFRGERFPVAEIEEIVIANSTMPYEDYQACRDLHLTVEIFNNDSIFLDLVLFLIRNNVSRSDFIKEVHDRIVSGDGVLTGLYREFQEEEKRNLWNDSIELADFAAKPGVIQEYIDGTYGTNELYKYRALAVFHHIHALHEVAYDVARNLLQDQGELTPAMSEYLDDLFKFSLMRKSDILDTELPQLGHFSYDFAKLMETKFTVDPAEAYHPEGVAVEIYHSDQQRDLISGYVNQYGTSLIGLGRILIRANMNRLYRSARSATGDIMVEAQETLRDNKRSHNNLIH